MSCAILSLMVIEASLPSGTVTFLFTDIEGSTRAWEEFGDRMGENLARHDEIMVEAITANEGIVFSRAGDSFAVAFHRPTDAASAALAAQDALTNEQWRHRLVLRVRMGIHTGEAQVRDGDYYGTTLNRAARIMGAGHGGQVLLSDITAQLLARHDLRDLGLHRLKDLPRPERLWQIGPQRHAPLNVQSRSIGDLPVSVSSFFGRAADVAAVLDEVATQRLVTLVGPGGMGKTRLALEVAMSCRDEFVDGVWFIDLAAVTDEGVVHAVAGVLGVTLQPGLDMVESLCEWLRDKRPLLVVDNCEHVVDEAARIVSAIVATEPMVVVLATSREPLAIAGERVWPVPELDAAVELFLARALEVGVSIEAVPAVADLCDRLDRMPLAIELAAARTKSMSVSEIADRLGDQLGLLRGRGRDRPERQRTLASTIRWSYDLLVADEQAVFDRLSMFPSSFDRNAASIVCADGTIDEIDVNDHLDALVEKSLLKTDRTGDGTRFRLLETFRQFGRANLDERSLDMLADHHMHHYAAVAEELGHKLVGPDSLTAIAAIRREWPNFRSMVDHADATSDPLPIEGLLRSIALYAWTTMSEEIAEWSKRVDAMPGATAIGASLVAFLTGVVLGDHDTALDWTARARTLGSALTFPDSVLESQARQNAHYYSGHLVEASEARTQAAASAESSGRPWAVAMVAGVQTYAELAISNGEEGLSRAKHALDAATESGDAISLGWAEMAYASALAYHSDPRSPDIFESAEARSRESEAAMTYSMVPMIRAMFSRGSPAQVIEWYQDAIRRLEETRNVLNLEAAIQQVALKLVRFDRMSDAAPLLGYSLAFDRPVGVIGTRLGDLAAEVRGDPHLAALLDQGAIMSRSDIVAHVLAITFERPSQPPAHDV